MCEIVNSKIRGKGGGGGLGRERGEREREKERKRKRERDSEIPMFHLICLDIIHQYGHVFSW